MVESRRTLLLMLALILAVVAVYAQVREFEFVNLDDDAYVTANPFVMKGLTAEGVRWAFTTSQEGHWSPLTWLSLMLDVEIFGVNAPALHLVNVALHLVNALLLFGILSRMTGAEWPSWIVAALFALHPLHVESVAWISERKDVLSTLFWMLTLGSYARYVETRSVGWYVATGGSFAAGLMAKSMLVTLPFVLLLLDFWPLRRGFRSAVPGPQLGGGRQANRGQWTGDQTTSLLAEKALLVALTLVFSVVAYVTQLHGRAIVASDRLPLGIRVANALVAYVRYLLNTVWPTNLAVFYPYDTQLPAWQPIAAASCLALISLVVVRLARRHPYAPVGWFWYLGTLVPVIGLVQIGGQALADRYTYVPLIGIFILLTWGGQALVARLAAPPAAVGAAVTALIGVYAAGAWHQVGLWRNSETLLTHAAATTGDNAVVRNNLGVTLMEQGHIAAALAEFRAAARIAPGYADAHNNVGAVLGRQGQHEEAAAEYRLAVRYNPASADFHRNLGLTLLELGRVDEAIPELMETVRLDPGSAVVRYQLGIALIQSGKSQDALAPLQDAIRLKPDYAEAHNDLGVALMSLGRREEAIGQFEHALRLKPDLADAIENLRISRQ